MRNRNKLKPALALLLAAAMALTGPAQSMTCVQAVETQESEDAVSETDSKEESTVESDSEAVSYVEVSSEQMDTEESVLESVKETSAAKMDEITDEDAVIQDNQMETDSEAVAEEDATEEGTTQEETNQENITEETTQEESTEETTQDETEGEEEATEEFLLPAANKEDAIELFINQKEDVIIKEDMGCGWYSFTPEEDGTYVLKMTCDELDYYDDYDCYPYGCYTSGLSNSFNFDNQTNKGIFTGKAGKTVYFQPYVEYNVWEDRGIEEIMVSITILRFPDKEEAVSLSVNTTKKFVIQMDEECSWYSFTPKEDGAYALSMICDGLDYDDYWCTTSGLKNSFSIDRVSYKTIFIGKAGETVYFQPYVPNYVWKDYEIETTRTTLRICAIDKGTASVDSNEGYILSYDDVKIGLNLDVANTSICCSVGSINEQEEYFPYYLGVYCTGMSYNNSNSYYPGGNIDDEYVYDFVSFKGLDINMDYHLQYVLYVYDEKWDDYTLVWFDGTDMPFDVCTKQTDKVGGELFVTENAGVINVEYNLFWADTAGSGGYVRYRKSTEEEWIYEEVHDDKEGRLQFYAESETTYIIELVSKNKTMIYDSVEITTEKYDVIANDSIKAAVRKDSITTDEALIDISGFASEVKHLEIQIEYTDSFDELQTDVYSYNLSDEWDEIPSGTETYTLNNLKAGTEYNNVKIRVESISYSNAKSIYTGQVNSFETKESPMKEEDIIFELMSVKHQSLVRQSAEIKVTINGILQEGWKEFYSECRCKGSTEWQRNSYCYFSNMSNAKVIDLDYLEPDMDYEIRYRIDGIVGTFEFHCPPVEFTGSVKPEIKVTNTYVNGLELECSLNGTVNSEDKYTCRFETDNGNGWWYSCYPWEIELDDTKTIKQQVYSTDVYPGQKQKWRYRVYQNGSEYYVGYFESETKPLELEITSIKNTKSEISGVCTAVNKEEIIIDEHGTAYIKTGIQLRKKGQESWKKINYVYLVFYSDGVCYFEPSQWNYPKDLILEPCTEYELQIVNYDNSITYGKTSFTAEGSWDIETDIT
ncbi:MAG: hypothetical protein K2M91_05325, partial [Lachnospiraceae bacterium]|nr:hypothetical protein [Lachnospiraceae bacterium]